MKKLIFAAAVVAAAFGLKAELASANVVGYTTRDINNKFVISAGQFDSVGGEDFSIQNVGVTAPATVSAWVSYEDMESDDYWTNVDGWDQKAPQIQIPNADGTGYTIVYYVSDARSAEDTNAGAGWVDGSGYLSDAVIPAGMGIWTRGYKDGGNSVNDTTLQYAGEVNGDDSQNIAVSSKFQLRSIPYPKAFALNGVGVADWTVLTPVNAWVSYEDMESDDYWTNVDGWDQKAPQIQIPNAGGTGYTIAYYVSDARSAEDTNAGAGWADGSGYLLDIEIPVGIGVWFNARKTVNIAINK